MGDLFRNQQQKQQLELLYLIQIRWSYGSLLFCRKFIIKFVYTTQRVKPKLLTCTVRLFKSILKEQDELYVKRNQLGSYLIRKPKFMINRTNSSFCHLSFYYSSFLLLLILLFLILLLLSLPLFVIFIHFVCWFLLHIWCFSVYICILVYLIYLIYLFYYISLIFLIK